MRKITPCLILVFSLGACPADPGNSTEATGKGEDSDAASQLSGAVTSLPEAAPAPPADPPVKLQAIIWAGGATRAAAEAGLLEWRSAWSDVMRTGRKDVVYPIHGFPRIVHSDDFPGLNSGFHLVLLGLCADGSEKPLLKGLRRLKKGAYVREVTLPASREACPLDYKGMEAGWLERDALIRAIKGHDLAAVQELVEGGAAVNLGPRGGDYTPLTETVRYNSLPIAEYLLAHGADPSASQGQALETAQRDTKGPFIEVLRKAGARRLARTLERAAYGKSFEGFERLVKLGTAYDDRDYTGTTLLDRFALFPPFDRKKAIHDLLEGAGEEAHLAAWDGQLDALRAALEAGKPGVAASGWTPLHLAALAGHLAIVEELLTRGAAIDAPIGNEKWGGHTALILAVRGRHLEVVDLLIKRGANLQAQADTCCYLVHFEHSQERIEGPYGVSDLYARISGYSTPDSVYTKYGNRKFKATALHIAALNGSAESVAPLLNAGVEPGLVNGREKLTPLMMAAANGYKAIVVPLLDKGAALDGLDNDGHSALWMAAFRGQGVVLDALLGRTAEVDWDQSAIIEAVGGSRSTDAMMVLSERGFDFKAYGMGGVDVACEREDRDMFDLLTEDLGASNGQTWQECAPEQEGD